MTKNLWLFFFLVPLNFIGQISDIDPALIQTIFDLESVLANEDARDETISNFETLCEGEVLRGYDQLVEKAIYLRGERDELVSFLLHKKGVYHYRQREKEKALMLFLHSLRIRRQVLAEDHPDLANSCYTVGVLYQQRGSYAEAAPLLKDGLAVYEKRDDTDGMIKCNERLGKGYEAIGDYHHAESYFRLTLDLSRKAYGSTSPQAARQMNNLGLALYSREAFSEAESLFEEVIQIYLANGDDFRLNIARAYNNLALIFSDIGQPEKALAAYREALVLRGKELEPPEDELADNLENIGLCLKDLGRYEEALSRLREALTMREEIYGDRRHAKFNQSFHNLGATYLALGDPEEALRFFQLALHQQLPGFSNPDPGVNPPIDGSLVIAAGASLLKDLTYKADAFHRGYLHSQDPADLRAAYDTYLVADRLIDRLRGAFNARGSKLFWLDKTYTIFEQAIAAALELYRLEGEESYLEQVYLFMEKNKAVLLLETLRAGESRAFAYLPDSLLQRQEQWSQAVSDAERELIEARQAGAEADRLTTLENELFGFKRKLADLENHFREAYPGYHRLTRNLELTGLREVQSELLDGRTGLLEFFVGDSTVYSLAITDRHVEVFAIPRPGLDRLVKDLRRSLAAPLGIEYPAQVTFERFSTQAFQLYDRLLGEALATFPAKVDRLVVVPDGPLAAVPFAVLLRQPPASSEPYYGPEELAYLLNDFTVSYAHSVTWLTQIGSRRRRASETFVGLAPLFRGNTPIAMARSCTVDGLGSLGSNETEVENIHDLLGGRLLIAEEATKENFLVSAADGQILHLSTHACLDDSDPAQSRIFFTDDYLYAHEIYHLDLNADMVVLSACETGIGEFRRGEGMMSLARGFAYSGTPSTTMSLWSVNDATTAELMQLFYQHLSEGLPKDRALRQARLDFLRNQTVKERLHPFYWGAFIHVGDPAPVDLQDGSPLLSIVGLAALLVAALLGWIMRRPGRSIPGGTSPED